MTDACYDRQLPALVHLHPSMPLSSKPFYPYRVAGVASPPPHPVRKPSFKATTSIWKFGERQTATKSTTMCYYSLTWRCIFGNWLQGQEECHEKRGAGQLPSSSCTDHKTAHAIHERSRSLFAHADTASVLSTSSPETSTIYVLRHLHTQRIYR